MTWLIFHEKISAVVEWKDLLSCTLATVYRVWGSLTKTVFKTNGRPVTPGDQKLGCTSYIWPWARENYSRLYKEGNFLNISGWLRDNFSLKHCEKDLIFITCLAQSLQNHVYSLLCWRIVSLSGTISYPMMHMFMHPFYMSNVNTLRLQQNGCHFPDNIFTCIFLDENVRVSIKISLKFVPKGPISNMPALVQIMLLGQHQTVI